MTLEKTLVVATEVNLLPLKSIVSADVPSEAKIFPRIDLKVD